MAVRWVLFVEVQGLYAAVLRQEQQIPDSRPLCVVRDDVVWDGCRLAFERGLQRGAPARQARRDCPDAVLLPYEAAEYDQAAQDWWNACLRFTPWVEPVAPHQVFLSLPIATETAPLRPVGTVGMQALPSALRAEVGQLLAEGGSRGGVTFVGAAPSKLVARAAAERVQAGWFRRERSRLEPVVVVYPGEEPRFLSPLSPGALWLAPLAVRRRLERLGLRSIGEIAAVPEPELIRQLGPMGRQVAAWARGVDQEPVRPLWPPREEVERFAFGGGEEGADGLERAVTMLAGRLAKRLAARHEGCLQVSLTLEQEGEAPKRLARTLPKLQQEAYPLQQALLGLLQRAAAGSVSAVTAGIGQIGPMPWKQADLWDGREGSAAAQRREQLERALLALNERFPARVVGLGPRTQTPRRESMLQLVDPYRWKVAR